jgi:hypothetical protein
LATSSALTHRFASAAKRAPSENGAVWKICCASVLEAHLERQIVLADAVALTKLIGGRLNPFRYVLEIDPSRDRNDVCIRDGRTNSTGRRSSGR